MAFFVLFGSMACRPAVQTAGTGPRPENPSAQAPLQPIPIAAQPVVNRGNDPLSEPVCRLQHPLRKGTWTTVPGGQFKASRSYAGGHSGLDFAPYRSSEKIFATAVGRVFLDPKTGEPYGNRLSIEHPPCDAQYSFVSFFAHNSRNLAAVGAIVRKGELIAYTGNTGSASRGEHLHFDLENRRRSPTLKTGTSDTDGYFVNPISFMSGYPE
jgi:murein DD-endopeptidase MepM/ murein hydrolase activator NlpD